MSTFQKIIKYVGIAFALFLALTIIGGICAAAFGLTKVGSGTSVKTTNNDYTFTSFDSMDIDAGVADVQITVGDGYSVECKDVPESTSVEIKSDGVLVIKTNSKWDDWMDWFKERSWNKDSTIYITVPDDFEADKIKIQAGSGNISIDGIECDSLEIDGGAGDVQGNNLDADEVEINAGVGDVDLQNVDFGETVIKAGVGNVNISGKFNDDCEIDGGVGNVDLVIDGEQDDFDFDLESGVGTVRINGESIEHLKENDDNDKTLTVDGGVGNIDIEFIDR